MLFNQVTAATIQTIARKILRLDIQAKNNLQQFEDKVIQINIEDLGFGDTGLVYYFSFKNAELTVSEQCKDIPATSISGKLSAFIAAAAAEHSSDSIFKGELNFSGDIGTAKQFQSFAQSLNIDWHEPLAQILGDPIAHTLATGLEKFSNWIGNTIESVNQDISEYVQEEAKVTPSVSEQQQFFQQVDQIRSKSDRLLARVNLFKQSAINKTNASKDKAL